MTETEALKKIREAIAMVSPGSEENVTMESDLQKDDILDSLDLMNFLFELETLNGSKLTQINETFDDYRVSTLVSFMTGS